MQYTIYLFIHLNFCTFTNIDDMEYLVLCVLLVSINGFLSITISNLYIAYLPHLIHLPDMMHLYPGFS